MGEWLAVAVKSLYGESGKLKDGLTQRLAGDRASVNAYTTDHDDVVDQGNAFSRLCPGDRTLLARWATADYDKIIIRNTHFVGPPIHNESSIGFFVCQKQPLATVFLRSSGSLSMVG